MIDRRTAVTPVTRRRGGKSLRPFTLTSGRSEALRATQPLHCRSWLVVPAAGTERRAEGGVSTVDSCLHLFSPDGERLGRVYLGCPSYAATFFHRSGDAAHPSRALGTLVGSTNAGTVALGGGSDETIAGDVLSVLLPHVSKSVGSFVLSATVGGGVEWTQLQYMLASDGRQAVHLGTIPVARVEGAKTYIVAAFCRSGDGWMVRPIFATSPHFATRAITATIVRLRMFEAPRDERPDGGRRRGGSHPDTSVGEDSSGESESVPMNEGGGVVARHGRGLYSTGRTAEPVRRADALSSSEEDEEVKVVAAALLPYYHSESMVRYGRGCYSQGTHTAAMLQLLDYARNHPTQSVDVTPPAVSPGTTATMTNVEREALAPESRRRARKRSTIDAPVFAAVRGEPQRSLRISSRSNDSLIAPRPPRGRSEEDAGSDEKRSVRSRSARAQDSPRPSLLLGTLPHGIGGSDT